MEFFDENLTLNNFFMTKLGTIYVQTYKDFDSSLGFVIKLNPNTNKQIRKSPFFIHQCLVNSKN